MFFLAAAAAQTPQAPATTAAIIGIQWVKIPGGTFMMGGDVSSDSRPRRQVTIKTFSMAKTLVTNRQYAACVASGACTLPQDQGAAFNGVDQPVVGVDWNQAKTFARWAGGRLPSEAEWEYAARSGGKDRKYPWGDFPATCGRAVIAECNFDRTAPVCSRPEGNTEQGLCDMAGNVWEWAQDWYHGSYKGAPTDGRAWENPAGPFRVNRGGAWVCTGGDARSAYRHRHRQDERDYAAGFRVAR